MEENIQTPPLVSPVISTSPSKTTGFPIFFVVLILVLLTSTGVFAYQNWLLKQQLNAPTTYEECLKAPGSVLQVSYPGTCVTKDGKKSFKQILTDDEKKKLEPPDPTANWKTYTDSKYGFSFNHPNLDDTCCRLAGAISDNPVHIVTLADKSTVRPNSDAPFDGLAVYIVPNKNDLSLVQYVEKEKASLISDFESMADPGQINQGVTTKTSINGLPAMVLSNYSWDGITRTYFKSNNNNFIFEISKNEESPNHFTSYDQILSTFKFVEQSGDQNIDDIFNKIRMTDSTMRWSAVTTTDTFRYPAQNGTDLPV